MKYKGVHINVLTECFFIGTHQIFSIIFESQENLLAIQIITIILAIIIPIQRHIKKTNKIQDLMIIVAVSLMQVHAISAFIYIKIILQIKVLCRLLSKKEVHQSKNIFCILLLAINLNYFLGSQTQGTQNQVLQIVIFNLFYLLIFADKALKSNFQKKAQEQETIHQDVSHQGQFISSVSVMRDKPDQVQTNLIRVNMIQEVQEQLNSSNISRVSKSDVVNQNFLQSILTSYPDGVIILKANLKSIFINNILYEMFKTDQPNQAIDYLMRLANCHEQANEHLQYDQMFKKVQQRVAKLRTSISDNQIPNLEESINKIEKSFDVQEEIQEIIYSQGSDKSDESDTSDNEYLMKNIKNEIGQKQTVKEQYENMIKVLDDLIKLKGYQLKQEQSEIHFQFQISMTCLVEGNQDQTRTFLSHIRGPQNTTVRRHESVCSNQNCKKQCFQIILKPFIHFQQAHVLIIVKDVTFLNKIEMLQQINENKSKMLSQVAHEFKNPLGGILLFLDSLQKKIDEDLVQKFISPIRSSIEQLLTLVNDLLDVAQLKAGKFQLNYIEIDLHKLLEDTISIMSVQARENIAIKIDFKKNVNKIIVSDPNRIRQIIINLIGNSVKFTFQGCITVEVNQIKDELICILVQDTGVGIKEQNQSILFSEFGKLDQTKDINPQGVGLGLMISNILAKRLAQNEFGETQNDNQGLQVQSELGKGSCFSFNIYNATSKLMKLTRKRSVRFGTPHKVIQNILRKPSREFTASPISMIKRMNSYKFSSLPSIQEFDNDEKQIPQDSKLTQKEKSIVNTQGCLCPQILIVDDTHINIMALQCIFANNKKYRVDSANGGVEALKKIDSFQKDQSCQMCLNYRVILMDIEMTDIDGIIATKEIRKLYSMDQIKIIGCSGHESKEFQLVCLQAGMNSYLGKPIKITEMFQLLEIYI